MPTRSTTAGALGRGSGAIKLMSTTNLFDLLANEFSVDDLRDLYRDKNRKDITGGALRNTLSKWRQQGLITDTERRGVYRKCEKLDTTDALIRAERTEYTRKRNRIAEKT